MMAQRETNWKPRLAGNEVAQTVERRYWEVNGGRQPFQIIVNQEDGVWEVGPFGPAGAAIQFGSLDPAAPFDGSFSALIARSLRPGRVGFRNDDEEQTVAGQMHPYGDAADYDNEFAAGVLGTIYHLDGVAARVRIIVDTFDPGNGGELACWVL
jgi:hypothetical protein